MSIVVFYMRNHGQSEAAPDWRPECLHFSDREMSEALKECQVLRADTHNAHVVMSSELRDMVGPVGVSAVEDGKTPDGHDYEWSKAGRAGKSRRNASEPPKTRQDMDR